MYIFLAILAFGILIFVHELGHFLVAKACGVKVTEFSMGMGPQLWHKDKGETTYSLRALPIGGFCAMEGEEEASEDPRAFNNQSVFHRFLILVAGAAMNFLLGLILVLILYANAGGFYSPSIVGFAEGCPYEGTLQVGDEVYSIDGNRIYFTSNFSEYAGKAEDGTMDIVVIRDGKKVKIENYRLVPVEYEIDGQTVMKYGINFGVVPATFGNVVKYSFYNCLDFVRMVRSGLVQLISGQASVNDMTGVVGMVDIINETGQSAETVSQGISDVLYLVAFIAVNLAVMNLLPLPALDGGHILTLLASWVIEKITGKKPDPRIEGYIHFIGLVLLLGLMVLIMYNDIARIIRR